MSEQAAAIRAGDVRALARAATGIENRDPAALALLRELEGSMGRARIVGVTGPPGAGKSTLVDSLAAGLRAQNRSVAIIAVDPSSHKSGGAILGDRIRMQRHHADSGIFIRSMATRGSTGGLARATGDMVRLMDASGKDYVLVETVGVGQDEIEIARLAQVTLVVLAPGMGDDIQAIKAGIMEIADVFVINKSDQPGAERVEQELRYMLSLRAEGPKPAVIRTVATDGSGIPELVAAIQRAGAGPDRFAYTDPTGTRIEIAARNLAEAAGNYESLGVQVHHVALSVPDLSTAIERLVSNGAKLMNQPREGEDGRRSVFIDPASNGGVLLELIQEK